MLNQVNEAAPAYVETDDLQVIPAFRPNSQAEIDQQFAALLGEGVTMEDVTEAANQRANREAEQADQKMPAQQAG